MRWGAATAVWWEGCVWDGGRGQGPGLTPELKGQRVDQEAGAGRNTQEGLAAGLCTAIKGRAETGTVRRADRISSQGSQYDVQTKEPVKRLWSTCQTWAADRWGGGEGSSEITRRSLDHVLPIFTEGKAKQRAEQPTSYCKALQTSPIEYTLPWAWCGLETHPSQFSARPSLAFPWGWTTSPVRAETLYACIIAAFSGPGWSWA